MYNTHLTPFGKFCQDLQEERHETSRQMTKKLEISSAFLCYVKHGQKKPTRRMLYNLIEAYHLHDDKKQKAIQTYHDILHAKLPSIQDFSCDERKLLIALIQNFHKLDQDKLRELLKGATNHV